LNGRAKPSLTVLVFASIVLIWGTTWLAIRLGLEHYPPFFSLAVRFSFAGPMLVVIMVLRKEPIPWGWKHQRFFILIGFLSFIMSFGGVYWAEQYLTSGMAAVIFAIMPLLTGIVAHVLLPNERLGRWKLIGLVVGLLGIVVIHSADLALIDPKGPLAATVILMSPLATAFATVFSKRRVNDFSALALAGIPMTYGAIMQWGLWFLFERDKLIVWSWPGVASIAYLALFGSLLTFTGYFWLLKRMEVSRLNLIAYFTPLVALSAGVLFASEPLPGRVILGALLVLCGIAIANRKPPRNPDPA
jgi:drug/metabolite transporter (DMT)-like permease